MLKLTELELADTDGHGHRPSLQMQFSVSHNVGALPTTLTADMTVKVASQGKVKASLVLEDLEADDLDGARDKMALWCDRMAAALRGVIRVPFDVPLYENRTFDQSSLPEWMQREYAVLAQRYQRTLLPEVQETRQDVTKDLLAQRHPLMYVSGALDHLLNYSYAADD